MAPEQGCEVCATLPGDRLLADGDPNVPRTRSNACATTLTHRKTPGAWSGACHQTCRSLFLACLPRAPSRRSWQGRADRATEQAIVRRCPVTTAWWRVIRWASSGSVERCLWKRSIDGKILADEVGFEPTEPFGSLVFKTSALNHSATHPHRHPGPQPRRVHGPAGSDPAACARLDSGRAIRPAGAPRSRSRRSRSRRPRGCPRNARRPCRIPGRPGPRGPRP